MTTATKLQFVKDETNKIITVIRHFDAPVSHIWRAWTERELLDQWWAPRPWKTETKTLDLRSGGHWLYAMVGPEKEVHWCRVDYKSVEAPRSFSGVDYFCDENSKPNPDLPKMYWKVDFESAGAATKVTIVITFDKLEDLETVANMGFQEGFTSAMENLDELFVSDFGKV